MRPLTSISVQILLAVVLTVVIVIGISSVIETSVLRERETQDLLRRAERAADRIANSLSYPLWNLNRQSTEQILQDEIGSEGIFRAKVFDEHGVFYAGKVQDEDGVIRDVDSSDAGPANSQQTILALSRPVKFNTTTIGSVALDVSNKYLLAELNDLNKGTVIKIVLLVSVLSIVLFSALRLLVVRPLSALKSWVESSPLENTPPLPRFRHSDEIDSLAGAFDAMSTRLKQNNQRLELERANLRELNARLEREIEVRRAAEEALKTSEEKFSKSFHASPVSISISSLASGEIVEVNEAFEKNTGYSRGEVLGRRSRDLEMWLNPKDRDRMVETLRRGDVVREWELQFRMKSGELRDRLVSGDVVNIAGEECLLMVNRDITERKRVEEALRESERRYRTLFESAGDAIFLLHDGVFSDCNRKAQEIFGCSREELIGKTPAQVSPERQPDGVSSIEKAHKKIDGALQGHPQSFDWKHQRLNGSEFHAEVTLNRIDLSSGIVILGIVRDVTARVQGEEELKKSENDLHHLTEHLQSVREIERKEIAREIHDELGQTLTALKFDIAFLNKALSAKDEALAGRAGSMNEMIQSTINTVRRISSELRPQLIDDVGLSAAIEWQVNDFQRRTGIICAVKLPDEDIELGPEANTAVYRSIQEALTNIVKHAGANRVEVIVRKAGESLELNVVDNGKGMDPSSLHKAKSFGLIGMKERIHRVGGSLAIEPVQPTGTRIMVSVPISGAVHE